MPELPEAETIARQLAIRLAGKTVQRVLVLRRDIVHGDARPLNRLLPGRTVTRVVRRAKRVVLELDPAAELIFHLGMSGRLIVCPGDQPPELHTHLRIAFDDLGCVPKPLFPNGGEGRERGSGDAFLGCELRFRDPRRFGGVWCLAGREPTKGRQLGRLGPEPLELKLAAFRQVLARKRQIKALLLDQTAIAGLGNIYCDEALHAAAVHPLTRADTLDARQARRLLAGIQSTLNRAIRFNGTTLLDYRQPDGREGDFRRHHQVYGRAGGPCRGCKTPIVRELIAGRSTFFCPMCQPQGR